MEDKKKKISDNLSKNLPAKRIDRPLTDKDVKDDYDFSRRTYKDLITTGVRSLDVLAELARESEHPRAFEVLSKSIKDIGDTTEKLMKLQKDKSDLGKEKREQDKKQITNNNVFVGSTADLQRMLHDKDDYIDAKN